MCSLAASSRTRASTFFSPRSLQRRGDVVGHRHRRVVDELLVDHRDVALAHRHAGHVVAVDQDPALGRRVEPGHEAHQRRLAGLRRAEQHGHRAAAPASGRAGTARSAAPTRLLDALERQLHARSGGSALRRCRPVRFAPARDRSRARPSLRCRPSLQRRQSTSSALRAHSCVVQVVAARASCRPGARPRRVAERRRRRAASRRARRRRAPAGARSARRQRRDGAARAPARSARSRCRAAAAAPIQALRSPPGRTALARPGAARLAEQCRPSWSAASSASLRKVVILPPQTDSSGAAVGVELEQVVARHRRRVARLVVEQRPHAGVAPDHVAPA